MPYGVGWKKFGTDLKNEISQDNIVNGAAALAFYLTLAIFPSMILLLSLVAYLPITNLDQAILDALRQGMPNEAAEQFSGIIRGITDNKQGGLLSFGALATLWAASTGTLAVMQQLNITYDVKEERSFIKARLVAIGLSLMVGALIIVGFSLIVLGGVIQNWLASNLGFDGALLTLFAVIRWGLIAGTMLAAFAVMYYFGPNVKQKFKFISLGSVIGVGVMIGASLLFRTYVSNFSDYSATYGSLGAMIVLMLWLQITGLVLLLGSEINSLLEQYARHGKDKSDKIANQAA